MADPEGTESEESLAEWRKEMKAKAKAGEEAAEKLAQAEQELALYKAGLGELTDKQVRALYAAHDGEVDNDSLKATAKELGFVKAETQPQAQSQPTQQGNQAQQFLQSQAEAFDRLDDAASGVSTPEVPQNFAERLAEAQGDQAKIAEILAQAGMLEQY